MPFTEKLVIFGGGLRTFACVKALLVFGIPPERIVYITNPEHEVEWEEKSGYMLTDIVCNSSPKMILHKTFFLNLI
jgi:hypothetical protein